LTQKETIKLKETGRKADTLTMKSSRILILAGVIFLLISFQNCSAVKPSSIGHVLTFKSTATESGNGGVYDGKPDATYYRYIPNFKCNDGKTAPNQIAIFKNGQFLLYDTNGQQCASQLSPLANIDIITSPFQSEFISVNDFLFKRYQEKSPDIPTNLAEILCRDNFEKPNFEIVAHYNRETNEALSRIYSFDQLQSDFSVSRILSSDEVRYVSSNVSFEVNFSKVIEGQKRYAGEVKSSKLSMVKTGNLTCVIGGSLDTSSWTTKILYDKGAENFSFLPNKEISFLSEAFRVDYGYFIKKTIHLFKISPDSKITDLTKTHLGDEFSIFAQNPFEDKNFMFFWTNPEYESLKSWYVLDVKKNTTTRITNIDKGSDWETLIFTPGTVTIDQKIFYTTWFFSPSTESVLRSYDVITSKITEIARNRAGLEVGLLPKLNQLVISYPESSGLRLQIYDIRTKLSRNLNVAPISGCKLVSGMYDLFKNEEIYLAQATCSQTNGDNKFVLVSLSDGKTTSVGINKSFLFSSENKRWIVFADNKTGQISIYNIDTQESQDLPSYVRTNFSNSANFKIDRNIILLDNRLFYGLSSLSGLNPKLYETNVVTGASSLICENALGEKISIGAIDEKKLFLLTYDSQLQIYRFYYAKNSNECIRINEFPSIYANTLRVIPATIGFSVTVGDGNPYLVAREAIFVPIDGRPPMKLSHNSEGPWQVELAPEKDRIILLGPDAEGNRKIISFEFN
jgi:hypothetical protein